MSPGAARFLQSFEDLDVLDRERIADALLPHATVHALLDEAEGRYLAFDEAPAVVAFVNCVVRYEAEVAKMVEETAP
jgi:hypothetical protein